MRVVPLVALTAIAVLLAGIGFADHLVPLFTPSPEKPAAQRQSPSYARLSNYASEDCGAKVLLSNAKAIGASNILSSNKDTYFLTPCDDPTLFVVRLCQTIRVSRVGLSNHELFSSQFKDVTADCSMDGIHWAELGNYTLPNQKVLHILPVNTPQWCKYVRVRASSHYGKEHYCTVTSFVAYGTSSIDELVDDIVQPEETHTTQIGFEERPAGQCTPLSLGGDLSWNVTFERTTSRFLNITSDLAARLGNVSRDDPAAGASPTSASLRRQKERTKVLEAHVAAIRAYLEGLNDHFVDKAAVLNMTLTNVTEEVVEVKCRSEQVVQTFETLFRRNQRLEVEYDGLLAENRKLAQEYLQLKNKYVTLELQTAGRVQTFFAVVTVVVLVVFGLLVFWLCMLLCPRSLTHRSKQYAIVALQQNGVVSPAATTGCGGSSGKR